MLSAEKDVNLNKVQYIAIDAAQKAGAILMQSFRSGKVEVSPKEKFNLTSSADRQSDEFLRATLKKELPSFEILSEETAPDNYLLLKNNADDILIIDPLDGTTNHSRGNANFGVSIGLVRNGITRLGVVYLPYYQETYLAREDQPYALLNNQPIHTSKVRGLNESLIALDYPYDPIQREKVSQWSHMLSKNVRQIKMSGSAVFDLVSVAAGRLDAYVQLGLKPWDVAAAALIVEKAGGKVTDLDGKPWDVFNHRILASNNILHNKLLKTSCLL